MSEVLELYTQFEDMAELAEGLAQRIEPDRLILYGPNDYEAGTDVTFALYLADGSAALVGEGVVAGSVDGGDDREEDARFDVVVDALRVEADYTAHFDFLLGEAGAETGQVEAPAQAEGPLAPDVTDDDDAEPGASGNFDPYAGGDVGESGLQVSADYDPLDAAATPSRPAPATSGAYAAEAEAEMDDVPAGPGGVSGEVAAVFAEPVEAEALEPEDAGDWDPGEGDPGEGDPAAESDEEVTAFESLPEIAAEEADDDAMQTGEMAAVQADAADVAELEQVEPFEQDATAIGDHPSLVPPAETPGDTTAETALAEAEPEADDTPVAAREHSVGPLYRRVLLKEWSLSAQELDPPSPPSGLFEYAEGLPPEALPPRPEGYESLQLSPAPHPRHAAAQPSAEGAPVVGEGGVEPGWREAFDGPQDDTGDIDLDVAPSEEFAVVESDSLHP